MTNNDQSFTAEHALSPLQEGILFDSVRSTQSGTYFEETVLVLYGPLEQSCLERAWQAVANRHEALRTRFVWEGRDKPSQQVMANPTIPWQRLDWRSLPVSERKESLDKWLRRDCAAGFELSEQPPLRLALISLEPELHYLILSTHHVLLDRWSIGIILSEVFTSYEMFRRGASPRIPAARPFSDYIEWIRQQDGRRALQFWRELLKGATEATSIARAFESGPQPAPSESGEGSEDVTLSQSLTASLRAMSRANRLTLSTVIQGAWAMVLGRYVGSDDVSYGVVVSGRPPELTGVTSIVGLFISTLPMRIKASPGESIRTMLQRLQQLQVQLNQYTYSSLVDIKAASELPPSAALFDALYVFQNLPGPEAGATQKGSLRVETRAGKGNTDYPLALLVVPGDRLLLRLRYDPTRLPRAIVQRMARHLEGMLARFSAGIEALCGSIPLLTPEEREGVREWNLTSAALEDKCVHELVAEQARLRPGATAIVCGGQSLAYGALEARSNQVAALLRDRGIGAENTIAVMMSRSINLLPALLGILKAGATYMPLDPASPQKRAAAIVRDSGARLAFVDASARSAGQDPGCDCVNLDEALCDQARIETEQPGRAVRMDQAAYVIYTSGSTGRPKGVVVSHRSLSNYVQWCLRAYPMATGRGALVNSSISFDLTITGLFAPLAAGREVWLVPDQHGPEGTESILRKHGDFSLIKITPAHLDLLADEIGELAAGRTHAFVIGGEALRWETVDFWSRNAPETALFNEYGPTEAAVGCCVYEVNGCDRPGRASVPIGRPIANASLYVLDSQLQLAPAGVPGELYIGGLCVARGYLNQPGLTAASFVADPLAAGSGRRMYRTGDIVRRAEDGNLEFLGRRDAQIKIRGFRVELGEIEAVLRAHPSIENAVVIVSEDGPADRQILAYVTARNGADPDARLKAYLRERLPEYMVPSGIVRLNRIPLTANGKIDRRSLPRPGAPAIAHYAPPRSASEEKLAAIWAELLRVDRVGIDQNFFELGGHSLRIFQLAARVHAAFGVKLPVRSFFDAPTVAQQIVAIALKQAELTGNDEARSVLERAARQAREQAHA